VKQRFRKGNCHSVNGASLYGGKSFQSDNQSRSFKVNSSDNGGVSGKGAAAPGAGVQDPPFPERLSTLLRRLSRRESEKMTVGELARALRDRGFGALMILLAAPNLIPMPPGTSTIFGLPLLFIAYQLIVGYRKPLLPRKVRLRELQVSTVRGIVDRIVPWIERFEKVARPRAWVFPQRTAEQLIGGLVLLLGFLLILPIPLGNFLPGISVILLALGLGERDGLWTAAGIAATLVSIGVIIGVVATAGLAVTSFF